MLNENNLHVAKFVSKDAKRGVLTAMLVTPKATVATDGYRLLQITVPSAIHAQFPETKELGKPVENHPSFLLDATEAKLLADAIPSKPSLPGFAYVPVVERNKKLSLVATDGQNHTKIPVERIVKECRGVGRAPDTYVDYERVIPKEKAKFIIRFDASLLAETLAAVKATHDDPRKPLAYLSFYGPDRPVRIDWMNTKTQQEGTAVVMPCRGDGEPLGSVDAMMAQYERQVRAEKLLTALEAKWRKLSGQPFNEQAYALSDLMKAWSKAPGASEAQPEPEPASAKAAPPKAAVPPPPPPPPVAPPAADEDEEEQPEPATPAPLYPNGAYDCIRKGEPARVEVRGFDKSDRNYSVVYFRKSQRLPIGESVRINELALAREIEAAKPAAAAAPVAPAPASGPRSWKPQQFVEGKWQNNGLRFPTKEEAEQNAADLFSRWTMSEKHQAVESDDEPNYRYVNGHLEAIEKPDTAPAPAPAPVPAPAPAAVPPISSNAHTDVRVPSAPKPASAPAPKPAKSEYVPARVVSHDELKPRFKKAWPLGSTVQAKKEKCQPCNGRGRVDGVRCTYCYGSKVQVVIERGPDGTPCVVDRAIVEFE